MVANGQRRHVDGYAGGRGSSPTRRTRGAGVKMNGSKRCRRSTFLLLLLRLRIDRRRENKIVRDE